MRKIIIPPIKCQGIKSKLAGWILEFVKLQKDARWIEPFMGSGVVGFNLQPEKALFCDINPHLINFYNSIKAGEITSETAREFLEKEGALLKEKGESYYYFIRERFNETKNFEVVTRQHFYHVGASEKNRKPMTEALVLDYAPRQNQVLYQSAQAQLFG